MAADDRELAPGLWELRAAHPEWTEDEGGDEGWDRVIAWWAARTSRGLLLVDPLVEEWAGLDALVESSGGCAGVVRTIHWHERSASAAADRYGVTVWAGDPGPAGSFAGEEVRAPDHAIDGHAELWDGIEAFTVGRDDEIAVWLAPAAALVFGDVVLGGEHGGLRLCPESWTSQTEGGRDALRSRLRPLTRLPVERVLVSHGSPVLAGGGDALRAAIG